MSGALSRSVWLVALAKLGLHLASSARGYGFFGDELYYIACAEHLDWGYVDHAPLSIWLLSGWQAAFGDSLAALRLLPALIGAASVVVAAALARELGGRAQAQCLTALLVALAPVNLVVHGYYSMNAVDILVWEIAFVGVAQILRDPTARRWLVLGVVLGLGLQNKVSVSWLGMGLFAGLLLTPHRRLLRTPWPWVAGGLAGLLFLPHVLWQVAYGFPTLEFVRVATTEKMVPVGPLALFGQQALVWNPLALPIWVAGLVVLLRGKADAAGRIFAIVFLTTAAILVVNGTSRPNYLALAQPPLLAAGAIAIERASRKRRLGWLAPMVTSVLAVVGLLAAPLTLPILAAPDLVELSRSVGVGAPQMEDRAVGALDPHFADMHGWASIVDAVAEVYAGLPAEDRAKAAILAPSYGEAGAIDRLGPERGLPKAISGHNSYWLWGPGVADGSVVVIAGGPAELWRKHWTDVRAVTVWDCGYCLPGRNQQSVYVARGPRAPMDELWPLLRHYD